MLLNSNQLKATLQFMAFILVVIFINMIMARFNLYVMDEENMKVTKWLNLILTVVITTAIWYFLSIALPENKKEIYIVGALNVVSDLISTIYHYFFRELASPVALWTYLLFQLMVVVIYAYLGYRLFGRNGIALFTLVGVAIIGIGGIRYASVFKLAEIDEVFWNMQVYINENSWREYDLMEMVFNSMKMLFTFMITIWAYNVGNVSSGLKAQIREMHKVVPSEDIISYRFASVFIGLRILMAGAVLGGFSYVKMMLNHGMYFSEDPVFKYYVIGISSVFATYFLILMIRNWTLSYAVKCNQYPGFVYWLLWIPVVNIIGLIVLMLTWKPRSVAEDTLLDDGLTSTPQSDSITKPQWNFSYSNKNAWLKVIVILLGVLSLFVELKASGWTLFKSGTFTASLAFCISLVQLGLAIWFMEKSKAYGVVVGMLILLIFGSFIFLSLEITIPILISGLVNLILVYPMFHFDKMEILPLSERAVETVESTEM